MSRGAGVVARGSVSAFVGRRAHLAELRDVIGATCQGMGSLVLLTGEPGIGKSRLLTEVARHAESLGVAVRWGMCWEGAGTPAYWPWTQLVRAHAADTDETTLAADAGSGAGDIVRVAPELGPALAVAAGDQPAVMGDQARFRMFDSIASLFRRASRRAPLLLAIEDLQWSDTGSLLLLSFLARDLGRERLAVVATVRDVEVDPASEAGVLLDQLHAAARVLALRGFGEAEVRSLLGQVIGPHQAARLATEVHRRSGGNPLFVRELGSLLLHGSATGLGGAPSIPETVRAVLVRRLAPLGAGARQLLELAASAGDEFSVDLLAEAAGLPRAQVLELIDEAVRSRLVVARGGARAVFAFGHALIREALYEQLAPAERAGYHRRLAEAMERLPGADEELAQLAHHFLRSDAGGHEPRAAAYAEAAGRRSLAGLAYEDAAGHFERALEALPRDADEQRARLALLVGDARIRAGDLEAARGAFEEAAATAERLRRPDLLAEAALGFGAGLAGFEIRLFDRAQLGLLEKALASLEPGDSPLRVWCTARLSVAATYGDSEDRRRALAADAVEMARRLGDPAALAYALGADCDAVAGPEHSERRLREAGEMIGLCRRGGDLGMELLGRRHRIVALLELGDVAGVDAELERFEHAADALRQPLYRAYAPTWRAMRALMEGRLADCRAHCGEALELAERASSENVRMAVGMLDHQSLADEGRFDEAAEAVQREIETVGGPWADRSWVALIAPRQLADDARETLDRLVAGGFGDLPRDANWLGMMTAWFGEAAAALDHQAAARFAHDAILPFADRFVVEGIAALCHGSVARHLGMLASTLGRFDDADEHFRHALDANRRAGATLLVAHTRRAHGEMLLRAGRRPAAEHALIDARRVYERLGFERRAAAVDALLGGEPAVVPDAPRSASPANVFRREGDYWTVGYAGRTATIKDAKGMRDIAALLAQPARELHVADLVARAGGAVVPVVSSQPVIDERAMASYRRRLGDLQEEIDDAEERGDADGAERARSEMDAIAGELAATLGMGGRARSTSHPGERARKAVAQRIRNALRRIGEHHPDLSRHLELSLRLGAFCSYAPERETTWDVGDA